MRLNRSAARMTACAVACAASQTIEHRTEPEGSQRRLHDAAAL